MISAKIIINFRLMFVILLVIDDVIDSMIYGNIK